MEEVLLDENGKLLSLGIVDEKFSLHSFVEYVLSITTTNGYHLKLHNTESAGKDCCRYIYQDEKIENVLFIVEAEIEGAEEYPILFSCVRCNEPLKVMVEGPQLTLSKSQMEEKLLEYGAVNPIIYSSDIVYKIIDKLDATAYQMLIIKFFDQDDFMQITLIEKDGQIQKFENISLVYY